MKRNLILLSSTCLLVNVAAFAAGTSAIAATNTGTACDPPKTATKTVATTKTVTTKRKMVIPPPPKETLLIRPGAASKPTPTAAVEKVRSDDSVLTIGSGGPYTAKNNTAQRFVDYIELKQGQESAPLTMTLTNRGFSWFRMLIANKIVATDKTLGGRTTGEIDLSGVIQSGTNQVVIQAGGVGGSAIEWKITTPSVAKLEKIDPDETLVGELVKIKGKGFSATPEKNEVSFNSKKGQVTQSKATELQVRVPKDADTGENKVTAKINGQKTNELKIIIRGIPEISGTNLQGVPPGYPVIVFGKNFSKKLNENQVFFDKTSAQLVSGNETQLTVIAPNIPYREGHYPSEVTVQVGKVLSKNSAKVQIGPQMFNDPGLEEGKGTPSYAP